MSTTEIMGCPFCSNANEVPYSDHDYSKVSMLLSINNLLYLKYHDR